MEKTTDRKREKQREQMENIEENDTHTHKPLTHALL